MPPADVIARVKDFYDALGKQTIVLNKDRPRREPARGRCSARCITLVGEGVVSVADADKAVAWARPALGLMGQCLTYHLGGGAGGIAHFLEHLSGPITSWWDDLGTPSFDPEVDRKLNDALRTISEHSMQELAAERDRLLVELIDARRRSFLP